MLGPEYTEHSQLDLVWRSLQLLDDDPIFLRGERDLPKPALVNQICTQETRTFSALSATERKSFKPSVT